MKKQVLFRADGDEMPSIKTVTPTPDVIDTAAAREDAFEIGALLGGLSRRPGIKIGRYFYSAELIIMVAMLVCLIVIARKN